LSMIGTIPQLKKGGISKKKWSKTQMIESLDKRNKKFMTSNNCEIVILSQSLKRIKILSSGPLKGINGGNRASSETARLNYKKRCLPRIPSRLTVPSL